MRTATFTMTPCAFLARLLVGIAVICGASGLPPSRRERKYFFQSYQHYTEGQCTVLDHPCNQVFNKTESERYAKFPNSRGLTLSGSKAEFNDFYGLLTTTQEECHLALWSLLCFHYFPQCHPSLPIKYIVTPCRELCERTRQGCEGSSPMWPEHLDCVKFNSSYDDQLCVNASADADLLSKVDLITTPTTSSPVTTQPVTTEPDTTEPDTTEPSTSPTTVVTPSTQNITTDPPTTPPNMPCTSKCNFRTRATGGTFKNNDYTFAANVTIINSDATTYTRHTFLAVITRLWILDRQNCSRYENHTLVVIRTTYSHCPACPSFNTTAGQNVYLVSGYCNDRGWYLPPNDSLVSPWHDNPKYETRLEGWIRNGINHRGLRRK